ncbi:FtsX-like permease family protein [Clostridium sp. VAP51]|uniref:FtsX-like permease family protein n=1 Tax=Clostridium sp. VAP51 TaxID=2949978 RepID=UPI002079B333|nr:FtsX-like permease family protein [Clostridium sp. VAP51]
MNIFKVFFTYFKRKKLKKLQLFIQIFICTISTIVFTGMVFNITNKLSQIKDVTSIYNIKGNFYSNYTDSNTESIDMNNLVSDLKNHPDDFDFCQFLKQGSVGEPTQLYIDNSLNNIIDFSVCKGRSFVNEDFDIDYNKNIIPILISRNLEHTYPLNSEFKYIDTLFTDEVNYLNEGATFKVIGVLDDSNMFWINDTALVDKLNYFDIIIYPTNFNRLNYTPPYYLINIKSSKNVYSPFKNFLEEKYPQIKLIDSSIKEAFLNKLQNKIIELIFIGIFTTVLLILSLFGFISIIQSMILLRHKEIGIHYSLGGSLNNILSFILLEIFIITASSTFISYLFINKLKISISINYEILLTNSTFFISLIINLIYILIATTIVTFTILKKDPIELLKD